MTKLKMAVQKSGRLNEESIQLLKNCGIKIQNPGAQLKAEAANFPIEILFLRNADIPQYLEDNIADVAIIGENVLIEKEKNVKPIQKLGFAPCRLSLAVPKEVQNNDISYFEGKKIATSYPNTLNAYLKQKNINADIHVISGSVEIAPNIDLADGICDLVSSGSTLFRNGLRESQVILTSEAVLAKSNNLSPDKEKILDKLLFRIKASLEAKNNKYVLMNVPNDKIEDIANLLPVLKSPTVLPLASANWSSMHTVIEEDQFWEVIDQLKANGAQDILIIPIDKMIL